MGPACTRTLRCVGIAAQGIGALADARQETQAFSRRAYPGEIPNAGSGKGKKERFAALNSCRNGPARRLAPPFFNRY